MQIEIGYTKSNRARICCKCGRTIPAREQSVKMTKKLSGAINMTKTTYQCVNCEQATEGERDE